MADEPKYPPGRHPNTLAALKSWKPGQSGSPKDQWKPGQSGNEKGRPVSVKRFIRDMLGKPLDPRDPDSITRAEALARSGFNKAMQGDYRYWKDFVDAVNDDQRSRPSPLARPDGSLVADVLSPDATSDGNRPASVQGVYSGEACGQDRDSQEDSSSQSDGS